MTASSTSASTIDCSSTTVNSKRLNVCSGVSSRAAWIDAGDRLGGSRRGDGDVEAELVRPRARTWPAIERTYDRQSRTRLGRHRAAGEEPVGQSHGAELEAAGRQRLAALADEHLGRAAADVDEDQPLVEGRHRLQHAEVDQPRLLEPGDHLDVDLRPRVARPVRGTRRSSAPRARRWWRRREPARRGRRRSAACGAATRCRGRWHPADSCFMSPPPWPRRTVSFSRVTISYPLSSRRATTRWKLLVPMSSAARVSVAVGGVTA